MKAYSGAVLASAPLSLLPVVGLWAPTRRTRLIELQICAAGTAIDATLIRCSTRGTPATNTSGEAQDGSNEASTSQLDQNYSSTAPVENGGAHAAYSFPGTIGNRILTWEFHDGLFWIEVGAGIIVKNISGVTGSGQECYAVWEE